MYNLHVITYGLVVKHCVRAWANLDNVLPLYTYRISSFFSIWDYLYFYFFTGDVVLYGASDRVI